MQEAKSLDIIKKKWNNRAGKDISAQGASEGLLTW